MIKVWSFPAGQHLYTLRQHNGVIWQLKFDRSRLLSSSFDQKVYMWDFAKSENTAMEEDEQE